MRAYGDALGLKLVELNRVVEERRLYEGFDGERGCYVADLNKLRDFVEAMSGDVLLESHLAHLVAPDYVIVLRADPLVLVERLRSKGFPERKIRENAEAEALDVILVEALEACGDDRVFEVDTSGKSTEEVAACIKEIVEAVIGGGDLDGVRKKYKPGRLDWSHRLEALDGLRL
ncbi:MAG: adenylate kinase family protein [Candidatus Alkanophagales archaeon]